MSCIYITYRSHSSFSLALLLRLSVCVLKYIVDLAFISLSVYKRFGRSIWAFLLKMATAHQSGKRQLASVLTAIEFTVGGQ